MKVQIYFNLHRGGWSIRDTKTRKVLNVGTKVTTVALRNVKFKVSESGRQRVLREKRKNVHAVVEGELDDYRFIHLVEDQEHVRVSYNPYFGSCFFRTDDTTPVRFAFGVLLEIVDGRPKVTAFDPIQGGPGKTS